VTLSTLNSVAAEFGTRAMPSNAPPDTRKAGSVLLTTRRSHSMTDGRSVSMTRRNRTSTYSTSQRRRLDTP